MKTLAYLFSSALILLLAFWVTSPRSAPRGATHPREVVFVPSAEAAKPPKPVPGKNPPAPSALLTAVEADDACAAAAEASRFLPLDPLAFAPLMRNVGAPPAVQELFGEAGALKAPSNTPLKNFHHPLSRLLFALRAAGIFNAATEEENLPRARELLLALEKEEPSNAAYPYFLLDVESRLQAPSETLKAIAERAARGDRFETYIAAAQAGLTERAFLNTSYFIALENTIDRLDTTNLYSSARVLLKLDDDLGTNFAARMGKLMQAKGRLARRGHWHHEFSGPEFDVGTTLRGQNSPTSEEFSRAKDGLAPGYRVEAYGPAEDGTCDDGQIREYYALKRAFLN